MIYIKQTIGWLAVLGLIIMGYQVVSLTWPHNWLWSVFTALMYVLVGIQWIDDNLKQLNNELRRRIAR